MKVALYARVSTKGQADKDLSIPDQLRQLREPKAMQVRRHAGANKLLREGY